SGLGGGNGGTAEGMQPLELSFRFDRGRNFQRVPAAPVSQPRHHLERFADIRVAGNQRGKGGRTDVLGAGEPKPRQALLWAQGRGSSHCSRRRGSWPAINLRMLARWL